jgi:predicted ATPase/DNA-binding CsgD family transcriptional regulator
MKDGTAALRSHTTTPMFGRSKEHAMLLELLNDPEVRLVTVTGRGGVGKTRLAIEVVRSFHEQRTLSVAVVALAGVSDAALVVPAIAEALDIPALPTVSMHDALTQRLQADDCLLVLDNFEHLIDAVEAVDGLIEVCGGNLRVLVTSQTPLRLRYERVLALSPLPLPPADPDGPGALTADPAVAIYCENAAAVDRRFELDESNATAVATLCRRLDGLPLAIELAAARAATLPAGEILRRLDADLLQVLRRARVDAPERHHGLHEAIEWTYRLLAPDEQRLLSRLSVFDSTFDIDAAAEMDDCEPTLDIYDALSTLVDLHLVDPVTGSDPRRFQIPSSIRAFGYEQLVLSGDESLALRRHVVLRARQARQAATRFDSADASASITMLAADREDLFATLQFALDAGLVDEALDLVAGVAPLWDVRGYHRAHEEQLDRALALAASRHLTTVGHADALLWSSLLGLRHGASIPADELVDRLRQGEQMAIELGADNTRLRAFTFRMLTWPYTGDFSGGQVAAERGLDLAERTGNRHWLGLIQVLAGMMAHLSDDSDRAIALGRAALATARPLNDSRTMVLATMLLGPLARTHPEIRAEIPTTTEALEMAQATGLVLYEALLLPMLVVEKLVADDTVGALEQAMESLHLAKSMPGSPIVGYNLLATVSLAARLGDHEMAARLHGAVRDDMPALERTMAPEHIAAHHAVLESTRTALGAERFESYARDGGGWSEAQAVERATAHVREALAPACQREPVERPSPTESPDGLTERRRDVLRLLAAGLTNKEIASKLGLAPKTVMHHTTAVYQVLGVRGRSEATAWAVRAGLVD